MSARQSDAAAQLRLQRLIADSFKRNPGPDQHASAMQVNAIVAQRLRLLRLVVGLDRSSLARGIGPEDPRSVEQRLWRYETGRARAPLSWLAGLAARCDLPVEFFVCSDLRLLELHVLLHRLGRKEQSQVYSLLTTKTPRNPGPS